MKRLLVLSSVLLLGGVVGCVGQDDLQALRADVMALERQRASRERDTEQRVQALNEQLTRLEKSQGDVRREMAQAISAAQELRLEIQNLAARYKRPRHRPGGNPRRRRVMRWQPSWQNSKRASRIWRASQYWRRSTSLRRRLQPQPKPRQHLRQRRNLQGPLRQRDR